MTEIEIKAAVFQVVRANQGKPKRVILKMLQKIEEVTAEDITRALLTLLEDDIYN